MLGVFSRCHLQELITVPDPRKTDVQGCGRRMEEPVITDHILEIILLMLSENTQYFQIRKFKKFDIVKTISIS